MGEQITEIDIQHPEGLIDCLGYDGKMHRVPILAQRADETLDEFVARARRVEESANGR